MRTVTRSYRDGKSLSKYITPKNLRYLDTIIGSLEYVGFEGQRLPWELAARIYAESIVNGERDARQRKTLNDMLTYGPTAEVIRNLPGPRGPLIYSGSSRMIPFKQFISDIHPLQDTVRGAFIVIRTKEEAETMPVMKECRYYIEHIITGKFRDYSVVSSYQERIITLYRRACKVYGPRHVEHIYVTGDIDGTNVPLYVKGGEILDTGVVEPELNPRSCRSEYHPKGKEGADFMGVKLAEVFMKMTGYSPKLYLSTYRMNNNGPWPFGLEVIGVEHHTLTESVKAFYDFVKSAGSSDKDVVEFISHYGKFISRGRWKRDAGPTYMATLERIWHVGAKVGLFIDSGGDSPCTRFALSDKGNEILGEVAFYEGTIRCATREQDDAADRESLHNAGMAVYCKHRLMDYTGFDEYLRICMIKNVFAAYTAASYLGMVMPK